MSHRHLTPLLASTLLATLAATVHASPIPSGISVRASVSADTVNSSQASNANQSGTLLFQGLLDGTNSVGVSNVAYNGLPANPSSLSGNFTDTSFSQVAYSINLGGTHNQAGNAENPALFNDLFLDFSNTGSTAYKAYFRIDLRFAVQANGSDAYVQHDFSLEDVTHNLSDIYYSREWRDTVNGNVSDTGGNLLQEVLLNPGDSVSFHGFESIKGGAYGDNSSNYSGDIYTSLQLVRFDPIGRQLPLPSSLWLAGLGLGLMLSRGTKRA